MNRDSFAFYSALIVIVPKGQRRGQFYMNQLWKMRPDLYRRATADKSIDPFYEDRLIPAFLAWLEANW